MERIVIIGGHGKVALHLARLLAERGDEATSVIRNPDQAADIEQAGATPLVLDVENADTDEMAEAFSGADAVIWSAGAGGGSAERTYAVDRDAAQRAVDAASRAGVRRFVMVSWIGSTPDHGIDPDDAFYAYADAKLAADDHLRASDLDWTILGPGTLTDDPASGRITTAPQGKAEVGRADVAAVAAAALVQPATIGRFIRFGGGETLIAEALVDGSDNDGSVHA
ncbi:MULTISPECIES: SDR family oxidoreductase [unclassified Microbacterium]|uniref:SDR family oxidoreductase n=1 Tax=unclassified Microbacterium TaxID=2609290 RepID=UPI0006F44C77|nr:MULTISPECIES: SDR family oxidoreductase [unclassified Microbacterium]KQT74632.1 NAD-dependent dehydratase [Microbacterium sp. Leaf436]MBD8479472.1 SDR family oxidoreductase [Microbacterium sp. CFBP 8794]